MIRRIWLSAFICLLLAPTLAWGQGKTIDQLTNGTALGGTEKLPMFQSANPAVSTTPNAIATAVAQYYDGIDSSQQAGADACARINNASQTLQTKNALGGVIHAEVDTSGIFACGATTMFAGWPAPPFYGTIIMGPGWIDTRTFQPIPKNAQVISPWLPVPLTLDNQASLSVQGAVPSGGAINPIAPAYFMTTGGSGTTCSAALPCGTFTQLNTNMQGSSTKLGFIRAGTYNAASYTLINCNGNGNVFICSTSTSDNNLTFSYFPPDGFASAILNGQGNSGHSSGADYIFYITGGAINYSVIGLQMENTNASCLEAFGRPGTVVQYNTCHDTFETTGIGLSCMTFVDGGGVKVLNNVVYNCTDNAIGMHVNDSDQANGSFIFSGNFVYNTCTGTNDCGELYYQDHIADTGGIYSRGCYIINNYARDSAGHASGSAPVGRGIYLDDSASNCLVAGNVMTGANGSCFFLHGGHNNLFTENICDVGATTNGIFYYQHSSDTTQIETGNVFKGNLILSNNGTTIAQGYFGDGSALSPLIVHDNGYYGYGGNPVVPSSCQHTQECNGDSNAETVPFQPNLYCYSAYMGGDQDLGAPLNFHYLTGNWGYPGYLADTSGTAPSWPHSGLPCTANMP